MKKLIIFLFVISLLIFPAYISEAGICDDTDALKLVQDTLLHSSQAGADGSERLQPIQDIYKNKWLISCAVANGITNLDKAGDYLLLKDSTDSYAALVADKMGGNSDMARANVVKLAESMKTLSQTPAFKNSVMDRTRVIGMYMLLLTFMIGLAAKLYGLILGSDNSDAIDFALLFIRFITILLFISFMKPLAFYGMQISTLVSNMLLDAPIQIVVSSNVGYTGPGAYFEGQSYSTPWFSNSLTVSSRYGKLRDIRGKGQLKTHYGVDFAAPVGTRLTAPYTGTATCKNNPGGYGVYIEIIPADAPAERHRAGHLSECRLEGDADLAADFKKGRSVPVSSGQGIGLSGNTGSSTGPHIHIDVALGGVYKDPGAVFAAKSGILGPSTSQPATGNPVANAGLQSGTNVAGTYSYEGNDVLTTDALFQEVMQLKSMTLNAKDKLSLWNLITGGFSYFFSYIVTWLARVISGAILSVLIILADCMMAITLALGPLVAALTLVPPFENYLQNWIKGYVTFLFYQPLAACFTVLSFVMMIVTMDTGMSGFLILTICYVMGCMKIPSIADGLSTSALVGVAMMMAFAPAMLLTKAVAMGAGALIGGPAGASVASSAVSGAGDMLKPDAVSPKASSGGKSGFIRLRTLILMILAGVMLFLPVYPSEAAMSAQEKKDLMNIMKPVRYPSPALVNDVLNSVKDGGLLSSPMGGMIRVGDSGVSVYNDGDSDNDMNGVYNTSYLDAIDMPMTRFVLGKADVDASMIYEMAFIGSYNKTLDEASAREMSTFLLENGFIGNMNAALSIVGKISVVAGGAVNAIGADVNQLRGEIRAKGDRVTAMINEGQEAITTKFMFWVPFYILILMFFIQLATIGYIKVTEPVIGDKASFVMTVPRLVLFMIFIYFFKDAVGVCITFSNYISNAIVPIETQRSLMANITSKTGGLIPGQEISGLMVTIFRALTYMSVKILLMARDMFMTITVIVGPICIALGYFTRYRNPDYIHQFFTGWIENFVKLLFWGPLAAIMLFCLGVLSVLTALDMMSVISVAVTALAFLYAAGNIPNLAERMSSVAIGGLLTAMSPMIATSLMMGGRGVFAGSMMAGGLFRKVGGMIGLNAVLAGAGGKVSDGLHNIIDGINNNNPLSKFGNYMKNGKKTVVSSSVPSDLFKGEGLSGKGTTSPNAGIFNSLKTAADQNVLGTAGILNAAAKAVPGANKTVGTQSFVKQDGTAGLEGKNKAGAADRIKSGLFGDMNSPEFREISNNIRHANENMEKKIDMKGIAALIKSQAYSTKDIFMGTGKDDGILNSAEFMAKSGLAGETASIKSALVGIMGIKAVLEQLPGIKANADPQEYFRTSENLRMTKSRLEDFIKTYSSGGFSDIPESELAADVSHMASDALGGFDSLGVKTVRAATSQKQVQTGIPSVMSEAWNAGATAAIPESELAADVSHMASDALGGFDSLGASAVKATVSPGQAVSGPSQVISSGWAENAVVTVPEDISSALPLTAREWLSHRVGSPGAARMVRDIRTQAIPADTVFGAPLGSEESRSVFAGYDIEPPSNRLENAAFQLFGLGVMRETAAVSGNREAVERIEGSVSQIKDIIKQDDLSIEPPINEMYGDAGSLDDPVLNEARGAAEYYSEHVSPVTQQGSVSDAHSTGSIHRKAVVHTHAKRGVTKWTGDMMNDLDRLIKESEHYQEEVGQIGIQSLGSDKTKIIEDDD